MRKGGYKIINLENYSLSDVATVIDGIYDTILDNYEKMLLISGMTEGDLIYDDMTGFAIIEDVNIVVTVGTKKLTITPDDEVTISNASGGGGGTYIAGDGINITNNVVSVNESVAKTELVADEWTTKTYNVGEYCIDDNKLWKCLIQNSERPSEGVNWTWTNVANEVAQLNNKSSENVEGINFIKHGNSVEVYAGFTGLGSATTINKGNTKFKPFISSGLYVILPFYNYGEPYTPVGSMWINANGDIYLYKPSNITSGYVSGNYTI